MMIVGEIVAITITTAVTTTATRILRVIPSFEVLNDLYGKTRVIVLTNNAAFVGLGILSC